MIVGKVKLQLCMCVCVVRFKSKLLTIHCSLLYTRKKPRQIDRNAMQVGIIEKKMYKRLKQIISVNLTT